MESIIEALAVNFERNQGGWQSNGQGRLFRLKAGSESGFCYIQKE
jgi:hypothetical protein